MNKSYPISFFNGILYGTTPRLKLFAADTATGKELWKYNPFSNSNIKPSFHLVGGVPIMNSSISEGGDALPSNIRAFDARSAPLVTAGEFVTPNTDKVKGKLYIAIVAGGTRYNLKPGSK